MSTLDLQNRWKILGKLDGDDDEVEKLQFASSSSKQEVKKKSKKEQGKILVNRFQSRNISYLDLFNDLPDDVKSQVRRRRRIELINEIPVKSLIRKRWGDIRGRNDLINKMPDDVKSLIFSKVGAIEILLRLQYVCSSWWKLSKDPHLFRVIDARDVGSFSAFKCMHCYKTYSDHCDHYFHWKQHWVRRAVDRSCGQLTELYIGVCANDELLHYVVDKSNALKCLVLKTRSRVSSSGLIEVVRKVPLLEEFELTYFRCCFRKQAIAVIVQSCLNLHKFALYYDFDFKKRRNTGWFKHKMSYGAFDVDAFAIAENMPKLRHLTLIGNLTNKGLQAILDGCPCLEYLDIRGCELELQEQCNQRLKHLTPPDYDLYDCDMDPELSHPSFTDRIDNLHDYIDKSEWSSSEEDDDDEDILKYLPPKADTFYI